MPHNQAFYRNIFYEKKQKVVAFLKNCGILYIRHKQLYALDGQIYGKAWLLI